MNFSLLILQPKVTDGEKALRLPSGNLAEWITAPLKSA